MPPSDSLSGLPFQDIEALHVILVIHAFDAPQITEKESTPLNETGMRVQADGDSDGEDAVLKLKAAVQDTLKVLNYTSNFRLVSRTYSQSVLFRI
jgi:hypothetical protein